MASGRQSPQDKAYTRPLPEGAAKNARTQKTYLSQDSSNEPRPNHRRALRSSGRVSALTSSEYSPSWQRSSTAVLRVYVHFMPSGQAWQSLHPAKLYSPSEQRCETHRETAF